MEDLFRGSEEESWIYWSLKTRKVLELVVFGDESKRTSPLDLRETEKPKGVVLWRVKTRSEVAVVRFWFSWRAPELNCSDDGRFSRRMISCGISHLCAWESVILILRRSLVSKLHEGHSPNQKKTSKNQRKVIKPNNSVEKLSIIINLAFSQKVWDEDQTYLTKRLRLWTSAPKTDELLMRLRLACKELLAKKMMGWIT